MLPLLGLGGSGWRWERGRTWTFQVAPGLRKGDEGKKIRAGNSEMLEHAPPPSSPHPPSSGGLDLHGRCL